VGGEDAMRIGERLSSKDKSAVATTRMYGEVAILKIR
jgi:hypothetical protein